MQTTWEVRAISLWFAAIFIEDWPVQSSKKGRGKVLFSANQLTPVNQGGGNTQLFFLNFNKSTKYSKLRCKNGRKKFVNLSKMQNFSNSHEFCSGILDWLIDWLIGRLINWSIEWMIDWLIDWSVDWLIDWSVDWSIHVLAHYAIKKNSSFGTCFFCWKISVLFSRTGPYDLSNVLVFTEDEPTTQTTSLQEAANDEEEYHPLETLELDCGDDTDWESIPAASSSVLPSVNPQDQLTRSTFGQAVSGITSLFRSTMTSPEQQPDLKRPKWWRNLAFFRFSLSFSSDDCEFSTHLHSLFCFHTEKSDDFFRRAFFRVHNDIRLSFLRCEFFFYNLHVLLRAKKFSLPCRIVLCNFFPWWEKNQDSKEKRLRFPNLLVFFHPHSSSSSPWFEIPPKKGNTMCSFSHFSTEIRLKRQAKTRWNSHWSRHTNSHDWEDSQRHANWSIKHTINAWNNHSQENKTTNSILRWNENENESKTKTKNKIDKKMKRA